MKFIAKLLVWTKAYDDAQGKEETFGRHDRAPRDGFFFAAGVDSYHLFAIAKTRGNDDDEESAVQGVGVKLNSGL